MFFNIAHGKTKLLTAKANRSRQPYYGGPQLSRQKQIAHVAPCKRIRNPESSKFLLLESGIHNGLESGIHFGMESGIQRVEIQNPDAGIRNLEAGIRNPGPSWILLHGATHGKTKLLTAKPNRSRQNQIRSRQNQIHSRQNQIRSRQNQIRFTEKAWVRGWKEAEHDG